jgi:hypothetical protein
MTFFCAFETDVFVSFNNYEAGMCPRKSCAQHVGGFELSAAWRLLQEGSILCKVPTM